MAECIWPGDEAETTFHLAAHHSEADIIGIASFYTNGHTSVNAIHPMQLRGMATHPAVRGEGAGKEIIRYALRWLSSKGVDVVWCNAREVAVSFYEALGFIKIGDSFEIPGIGTHWVMSRKV
jgi:predicted GNAT family N-acyltransferase